MHLKTPNFLKNQKLWLATFLIFAASFLVAPHVLASAGDWAGEVVGSIIYVFIWALGLVLILVMKALILIASYQNFINSGAVQEGWTVVRDLSNMFFVVILLVIAFSTILHLENYSYKKWLPKLVLMAVLINFSKTICGLLIDVAQIIMLTFVNAFKDVAGGNLIEMLGIREIVTLAEGSAEVGFWQIVGAYVLGLIYMIIALVVITTMMMMLVMRLVMIWIYVVLSPLAYLLAAFPGGAQYASQWWKEFISNLVVGPVIAFFIWLSFAALQTGNYSDVTDVGTADIGAEQEAFSGSVAKVEGATTPSMGTQASTPGVLIKFVIGIGMLIGGLKVAQQIGGAAGSVAGKGMGKLAAMGAATAAFGKKWGGKVATGDNLAARKFHKAIGADFRPMAIGAAIKSSFEKSKKDDEDAIRLKGISNLQKGGAGAVFKGIGAGQDWANNYVDGFLGIRGLKRAGQEIFSRPGQRKDVNEKLTTDKADLDKHTNKLSQLKSEREKYITTAEKQKIENEIQDKAQRILDLDVQIAAAVPNSKEQKALIDDRKYLQDGMTKEQDELNAKIAGNFVDDAKHQDLTKKIKAKEKVVSEKTKIVNEDKQQLARIAPPKALEGRGEYRKVINDRKGKYKDVTNSDELLQLFEDAVRRKDKFDQVAIMEKLSNDGNFNDLLNAKGYRADAKGMYSFLRNEDNDAGEKRGLDIGLEGQEILQVQNDLSESEERVGHWEMAKTVGINERGELESLIQKSTDKKGKTVWDDSQHVTAAASEIAKMDPQKIVIGLNRLAYGGEDGNGKFQLSNLGRVLVKMLDQSNTFKAQEGRIQQNIAFNLTADHVVDELKSIGISKTSLEILEKRGRPHGTSLRPGDILADFKKKGKIV
jgi:hypothetical protein